MTPPDRRYFADDETAGLLAMAGIAQSFTVSVRGRYGISSCV